MAGTRTRTRIGSELSRYARAAAIAEELHHECSVLLELYRKKEEFPEDLAFSEERLVTVPPSSSQLSVYDRVWRLYSALLQCRTLLEGVVRREEVLGDGEVEAQYEGQKKTVTDRLGYLLEITRRLLVDGDGNAALTPGPENPELSDPKNGGLFVLKRGIYRVYSELEHWALAASKSLRALDPGAAAPKERGKRARNRGKRARR
ncbi:uncharacterized protein LOC105029796 [Esox lucius]|uniref:Ciliary neurotrophic factor n=1 Tax=Esox lucius TaxID=8010 RepID=A0AAY5KW54_ESOLU|nr:uncharacterized protein LOC105029796 [Esox lucius]